MTDLYFDFKHFHTLASAAVPITVESNVDWVAEISPAILFRFFLCKRAASDH